MSKSLHVVDLRCLEYEAALAVQNRFLERKIRAAADDCLILVEHPHVFTTGRRDAQAHILDAGGVPVRATSRGGDVTYHGPGQLVVYPIIDLESKLRRAVHRYLAGLEQVIIDTLAPYNLDAGRRPPWTGVWVDTRKVCAIGIAVKRGVTYHGAALNVAPDLDYFRRIVPCGLTWAEVTSIERETQRSVSMDEVKALLVRNFCRTFGYEDVVRGVVRGGDPEGPAGDAGPDNAPVTDAAATSGTNRR